MGENIRDEVVPVLLLLEAAKGHLGAGNVLLGVLKVVELQAIVSGRSQSARDAPAGCTYEGVLVPGDALLLVGIGVGVAVDGAGLAAKEAVESGADLVALTLAESVALSAAGLEEVGTLLSVTCRAERTLLAWSWARGVLGRAQAVCRKSQGPATSKSSMQQKPPAPLPMTRPELAMPTATP